MKKIALMFAAMMVMIMTSCSGGYDQKKVDELEKKVSANQELTSSDYKTMVEQCNYIIDDMEGAKNDAEWEKENSKEAEALFSMAIALSFASEADENFPKDLKGDVEKIKDRFKKIQESALKGMQEVSEVETVEEYSY